MARGQLEGCRVEEWGHHRSCVQTPESLGTCCGRADGGGAAPKGDRGAGPGQRKSFQGTCPAASGEGTGNGAGWAVAAEGGRQLVVVGGSPVDMKEAGA